jgi:hypothetical protein
LEEVLGSEHGLKTVICQTDAWLTEHPEDVFTRAVYLWAVLVRGRPIQMLSIVKKTAEWLADEKGARAELKILGGRENQQNVLDQIADSAEPTRSWLESSLEDNLVRAAFLTWLKHQGKSSQLGRMVKGINDLLNMKRSRAEKILQSVMKRLWLPRKAESNLLRVCHLWLLARRPGRSSNKVSKVIEHTREEFAERRERFSNSLTKPSVGST